MFRRKNVDHITAHPKRTTREILVIAAVLHADQTCNHIALTQLVAEPRDETHLGVILRRTNAVNRTDGSDDDGVAPLQHALGGRQPHLLNVLIDGGVFLDEQIPLRHVRLRLVVVVIADEVLDCVLRKELAEFAVKLRRQRLVRRKHNGRPAHLRNHIGHGEGLAGTGDTQQGLEDFTVVEPLNQLRNRGRLVASGLIGHEQLKRRPGKAHKVAGQRSF